MHVTPADDPEGQSRTPRESKHSGGANDNFFHDSHSSDISLLRTLREWLRRLLGCRNPESLREVVEDALEEHSEQVTSATVEEKLLLKNVLDFSDLNVQDVMVQRNDVVAVPNTITLPALKEIILEHEYSRMPVYRKNLDDIIGFLHIKDLVNHLCVDKEFHIQDIMRPLMAVPPSMKVADLLTTMRNRRSHMALVIDEYGGADGIVTLEDVFEALVDDIQDEHDNEEKADEFTVLSNGAVVADARVEIERIEDHFDLALYNDEEDDFHTLGGLIFDQLGHVPEKGEQIEYRGLVFKITDADPRRIKRLRIRRV